MSTKTDIIKKGVRKFIGSVDDVGDDVMEEIMSMKAPSKKDAQRIERAVDYHFNKQSSRKELLGMMREKASRKRGILNSANGDLVAERRAFEAEMRQTGKMNGPFLDNDVPLGPELENPKPLGPFLDNDVPLGPSLDHSKPIGPDLPPPSERGGLWDRFVDGRGPQKVAGALGTAWLVQTMFGNRGEQSNAELYGQQ